MRYVQKKWRGGKDTIAQTTNTDGSPTSNSSSSSSIPFMQWFMTILDLEKMALEHPRYHVGLFFASVIIAATTAKDDPWSTTTSNDDPVLHLTASNYESTVFRSGRLAVGLLNYR